MTVIHEQKDIIKMHSEENIVFLTLNSTYQLYRNRG